MTNQGVQKRGIPTVQTCSVVVKVSAIRLVAGEALAKLCMLGNEPILSWPLDVICWKQLNAIFYTFDSIHIHYLLLYKYLHIHVE